MCLLSIAHWSVCAIGLFVQRVQYSTCTESLLRSTEVQYNAVPQYTVVLYGRGVEHSKSQRGAERKLLIETEKHLP